MNKQIMPIMNLPYNAYISTGGRPIRLMSYALIYYVYVERIRFENSHNFSLIAPAF